MFDFARYQQLNFITDEQSRLIRCHLYSDVAAFFATLTTVTEIHVLSS